jgi:hypothetical protein
MYDAMHVQAYDTVQYAGYFFKTAETQQATKTDNSNVRLPYHAVEDGRRVLKNAYGSIQQILTHPIYPGGQVKCLLLVDWFHDCGVCPVSGNPLVDTTRISETTLTFIDDCYQCPVAVWPHDPLNKIAANDPAREWSEIIDRNQEELL